MTPRQSHQKTYALVASAPARTAESSWNTPHHLASLTHHHRTAPHPGTHRRRVRQASTRRHQGTAQGAKEARFIPVFCTPHLSGNGRRRKGFLYSAGPDWDQPRRMPGLALSTPFPLPPCTATTPCVHPSLTLSGSPCSVHALIIHWLQCAAMGQSLNTCEQHSVVLTRRACVCVCVCAWVCECVCACVSECVCA
jgi:hypothetical protein